MAMVGIGYLEMLLILLMSAGGEPPDLASLITPADYFKAHGIEITTDKLVTLASNEPVDGAAQLAQLLALRSLGESDAFKKSANYQAQRKIIEEIAAGKKAQDKLGFAREYAERLLARLDGRQPPALAAPGKRTDGLAWFPETATFVAGMEYRPRSAGTPKPISSDLLKPVPPDETKELYKAADKLGNVEIKRLTLAYVDEGDGKGRNFFRFTGRINQDWFRKFQQANGLKSTEEKDTSGATVVIFTPNFNGPAMAIVGNHDVVAAGFAYTPNNKNNEVVEQLLAVRMNQQASAATGPLKQTLASIPARAVGYVVGQFPDDFRRGLVGGFGAAPKKITAYLEPAAKGAEIVVRAGMDNEQDAKAFIAKVNELRGKGLEALQKLPPAPVPGVNFGELKNALKSLELKGAGADVNVRMVVSYEAMKMLPLYFMGRAQERPAPAPVETPHKNN